MASQVDPLQSFTHLNDNVPLWLTRLDELVIKSEIQYERFFRLTRHGEIKLSRKKKSVSTDSLRPQQDVNTAVTLQQNKGGAAVASMTLGPTWAPTRDATTSANVEAQEVPRKRRAGSELSGAPSGHCVYRSKEMVVVYFDGEIQNLFEGLVKSIATARNSLRKGKSTASFKSRMASMGLAPPPSDMSSEQTAGVGLDPKMLLTKARIARQSAGNEMKSFEDADKDLEVAQNLCERAAHQFLRDGDCNTDIDNTRKRFVNCGNIAKREIERLKKEEQAAQKAAVEQKKEEVEHGTTTDSILTNESNERAKESFVPSKITAPPPLEKVNLVGTGEIEIDDCSDQSSMHIDISAIRRTVRNSRV